MSKIFRKFRSQIISSFPSSKLQGKLMRYLAYALGEIALVVFGILIAAQFNNNNENKKERDAKDFRLIVDKLGKL